MSTTEQRPTIESIKATILEQTTITPEDLEIFADEKCASPELSQKNWEAVFKKKLNKSPFIREPLRISKAFPHFIDPNNGFVANYQSPFIEAVLRTSNQEFDGIKFSAITTLSKNNRVKIHRGIDAFSKMKVQLFPGEEFKRAHIHMSCVTSSGTTSYPILSTTEEIDEKGWFRFSKYPITALAYRNYSVSVIIENSQLDRNRLIKIETYFFDTRVRTRFMN